jgi:hypothetical protein
MKKTLVLGLCLATTITVFSTKTTTTNERNLGVATVIVNNQNAVAYEDAEAISTAAVARVAVQVWNKTCKEVARWAAYEVAEWLVGYNEATVASVHVEDEMNSKLKAL